METETPRHKIAMALILTLIAAGCLGKVPKGSEATSSTSTTVPTPPTSIATAPPPEPTNTTIVIKSGVSKVTEGGTTRGPTLTPQTHEDPTRQPTSEAVIVSADEREIIQVQEVNFLNDLPFVVMDSSTDEFKDIVKRFGGIIPDHVNPDDSPFVLIRFTNITIVTNQTSDPETQRLVARNPEGTFVECLAFAIPSGSGDLKAGIQLVTLDPDGKPEIIEASMAFEASGLWYLDEAEQ